MLFRQIAMILGQFLFGFSATLLVPFALAIYYYMDPEPALAPDPRDIYAFAISTVVSFGMGMLLSIFGKMEQGALYRREGLAVVVLIWFLTPAIGALPFLLTDTLKNPLQAYFEATSGLTTTGASILAAKQYDPITHQEIPYRQVVKGVIDTEYIFYGNVTPLIDKEGNVIKEGIEAVSKPLLFWRSFLNWLGGVGIVVLYVAVLPALGVGGKILFYSEMTGPVKETLTPRIKETAMVLWKIYFALTLIQTVLLMATNSEMSAFDAITVSFGAISTGGFTVRNASIGSYHNAHTEWIVTVFMLLGSINFTLYFYCLKGKFYRLYDLELIVYLIEILLTGLFVAWVITGTERVLLTTGEEAGTFSPYEAIRQAFFHVISAQTSSGFSAVDYEVWPYTTQVLMLTLIYFGGMAGSTSSGIKMIRLIMLFRIAQNKIESLFHPERVRTFRIGQNDVSQNVAIGVLCFFLVIITLSTIGVFLLTLDGIDPQSALSVVASTINGSGFGFRAANPLNSYAFLPNFSLVVTSIMMILGRLEFFAVLVILIPGFWRQN